MEFKNVDVSGDIFQLEYVWRNMSKDVTDSLVCFIVKIIIWLISFFNIPLLSIVFTNTNVTTGTKIEKTNPSNASKERESHQSVWNAAWVNKTW